MPFRVAIVGLGKIARDQHLPAIAATDGIELAAIVSRNAALDGLPHFDTIEGLLASDCAVDALSLCTPPQPRRAQALAALEAGRHVMLEKPPGATVGEVEPLVRAAAAHGVTLFASWHSRYAAGVEPARALLEGRRLRSVRIEWREDVRVWHPGQDWIFEPGGLGVFDPGINALSILTRLLPQPLFVTSAALDVPSNRAQPIAATLALTDQAGLPIAVELDFLQTGPQTWSITIDTDRGPVVLSQGGAVLTDAGRAVLDGANAEYRGLYARFAALMQAREQDVDLAPLRLVADSFLLGRQRQAAPFDG